MESALFDRVCQSWISGWTEGLEQFSESALSDALIAAGEVLLETRRAGRRVFVCGNGTCASLAEHIGVDLAKSAIAPGNPSITAIPLEELSLLTAWANDRAWSDVYVRQLEMHCAERGDVLIAVVSDTASDAAIEHAVDYASRTGMGLVALGTRRTGAAVGGGRTNQLLAGGPAVIDCRGCGPQPVSDCLTLTQNHILVDYLKLSDLRRSPAELEQFGRGMLAESLRRLQRMIASVSWNGVPIWADMLTQAIEAERSVFVFGNGGHCATSSHFSHGVKQLLRNGHGAAAPVVSLTACTTEITGIACSSGYADVFAEQLRSGLRPRDFVFSLSTSGDSENVIRGIRAAEAGGAQIAGICGFDGGRMRTMHHPFLHVVDPFDERHYGRTEDVMLGGVSLFLQYLECCLAQRAA